MLKTLILAILATAKPQKVLLKDIKTLTFYHDRLTTGQRTDPVNQLDCIGGDACQLYGYLPSVVQCQNVGFDGREVQWKCAAELEDYVRLGETTVVCEGFKNKDDPYVLAGSCGLEYHLYTTKKYRDHIREEADKYDFLSKYQRRKASLPKPSRGTFMTIVYLTWGFIALILILNYMQRRRMGPYADSGSNYRPDPPNVPPPYTPPPYTPPPKHPSTNDQDNSTFGRGFLPGLLAGGAVGHLFSYLTGRQNNNRRDGNFGLGSTMRQRPNSSYATGSSSGISSRYENNAPTVRTSYGYGGTRSREDGEGSSGTGGSRRR